MPLSKGMGMGMGHGAGSIDLPTHSVYGQSLVDRHEWRSTVLLVHFMMKSGWQYEINLPDPHPDDSAETRQELDTLMKYQDEVEEVQARYDEIIAETHDYVGILENRCYYDAYTHPLTSLLVQTMNVIGWTLVQHFKEKFGRKRPSFLEPELRPIIRVPTFAAYPSGHATQSYLAALALQHVLEGRITSEFNDELLKAAVRIGENREYAGVHFATDTTSGRKLAGDIWTLVERDYNFQNLIAEARNEWERPIQSGYQFLQPDPTPEEEDIKSQL